MQERLEVIYKAPGEPPTRKNVPNALKALQDAVGGPIECVVLADDAVLICNEEGLLMGLEPNGSWFGIPIVGPYLIAGYQGDEFCDIQNPDWWLDQFTKSMTTRVRWKE